MYLPCYIEFRAACWDIYIYICICTYINLKKISENGALIMSNSDPTRQHVVTNKKLDAKNRLLLSEYCCSLRSQRHPNIAVH